MTWIRTGLAFSAGGLGLLVVVVTLLPLLPVGAWWVRMWDFPRLQIVAIGGVCGVVLWVSILGSSPPRIATGLAVAVTLAVLWQAAHVVPFSPIWPKRVPDRVTPTGRGEPHATRLSLLVVNLDYRNDRHDALRATIERADPDVLLLIEIDAAWRSGLNALAPRYPHRCDELRGEGLGIALWSKRPLLEAEVRCLVTEDRPSIHARLSLENGPTLRLVGVHPTPPALRKRDTEGRHDSRVRDGELMRLAREIAEAEDDTWVVAGDFNDVAWSHTTRLFQRVSGLGDPRIGRGMFGTYNARYPLLRYPLDHVMLSPGIEVERLYRAAAPGSDHFAMGAVLWVTPGDTPEPSPEGDDLSDAARMIHEGDADAREDNAAAPP